MARCLPRALSPGQWISIGSYARLQVFRLHLQNFTTLFKRAKFIYIQLKAPACQFFCDCVWLGTQQIGIEHAYPVLIELKRKVAADYDHGNSVITLPQRLN